MKFVVTDPCYIVNEDVWSEACKHIDENGLIDYPRFEEVISNACGTKVDICDTGYGDWSNSISGPSGHIINRDFCADAGMVCVAKLTPEIEEHLDMDLDEPNPIAAVIDVTDITEVSWRGSDNWTKLCIETPEGLFESEDDPNLEDDEDEDEDDWDDDDEEDEE